MDYANGKIYRINNDANDDFYIGSTTQPLCKRMARHRIEARIESKNSYTLLYKSIKELGEDHFRIVLIENYDCKSKEELLAREDHYIRELKPTLNGRTVVLNQDDKQALSRRQKQNWAVSKVYKIVNDSDDQIYIGSTCSDLIRRLAEHVCHSRHVEKQNRKIYAHMNRIDTEHFQIKLIESYPCNTKKELRLREAYWIKQLNPTLNMIHPVLDTEENKMTRKRWSEKNKERYICIPCSFKSHIKKCYDRHIGSKKHAKLSCNQQAS